MREVIGKIIMWFIEPVLSKRLTALEKAILEKRSIWR